MRASLLALASTVVVFGVLVWIVVNAPGWPAVQRSFLDSRVFAAALPGIVSAFFVNIQLFIAAEILVLVFGLVIAILRSLPGPVFFPVRLIATFYADIFRALPGLLVIFVLGFGIPGWVSSIPRLRRSSTGSWH